MSRTNKSWPTMTVPSFAKSSSILPAFRESTATSICLIWSWLLAVGPVNYRTRTDLVGFDAGELFVCGERVTNLLWPAFEGALRDGLVHLGYFDRFRYE